MFKKTDILFYKEACSLAFVIAFGLSLIVITVKLTSFSELIFASPNIFSALSLIFFYLLPPVLTTVLPIAIFTACALVAIRMNADKEIDALFASGMSMIQFLKPTFVFGILSLFLMIANTFYYDPYARDQFRFFRWYQAQQIVESFFLNNIKERSFLSNVPFLDKNSFVFYSNAISYDREMSDVFISLGTDDFFSDEIVMAKSGQFFKTVSNGYPDFQFELKNATIYANMASSTHFKKINLSMLNAFGSKLKSKEEFKEQPFEFTPKNMAKPISMAFCVLFFPALGVCLGSRKSGKSIWPIYLGIALIVGCFYSIFALANIVILHTELSIFTVYTMPPVLFFLLTVYMTAERLKLK